MSRNDVYKLLGNRFDVEFDDAHGCMKVHPPNDMTDAEFQRLIKLLDAASIVTCIDIKWPDDAPITPKCPSCKDTKVRGPNDSPCSCT